MAVRYLYIWGNSIPPLRDNYPECRAHLWQICRERGFDTLLAQLDYPLSYESNWVSFISDANAHGVHVYTLISWAYPYSGSWSECLSYHEGLIENVLHFNYNHPSQKIEGIAMDIEGSSFSERYVWLANTYFPAIKTVQYNGQTISSQQVKLYFYDDGLIMPGYLTQSEWTGVAAQVDIMELQSYGPTANDIIAKATMGTSRVGLCESMHRDYTIVIELQRYLDGVSYDTQLGWQDNDYVNSTIAEVDNHFNGNTYYKGICLHSLPGVSIRHLVHGEATVGGSTLTIPILHLAPSAYAENITIYSSGMTEQTFTPAVNALQTRVFDDYVSGQVTIRANRELNGFGPTIVQTFIPSGGEPTPPPSYSTTIHMLANGNVAECTPTSANTWATIDLDNYISGLGSDVTGVVVRVRGDTGATLYDIGLRKYNQTSVTNHQAIADDMFDAIIGVDSDHRFQAWVGSTSAIDMWITGYTTTGVTMLGTVVDKSLSSTYSWVDINCSSEAPSGTKALIFEVYYTGGDYGAFGLRKKGSTDNKITICRHHCWFVVGCDNNRVCQGQITDTGTKFRLIGYITDGIVMNTNASDVSLSSTGSWLDLPAQGNAVGAFIEVVSLTDDWYGLRRKGDTNPASAAMCCACSKHCQAIVATDSNGIIQGRISSTGVDFFINGVVMPASGVSDSGSGSDAVSVVTNISISDSGTSVDSMQDIPGDKSISDTCSSSDSIVVELPEGYVYDSGSGVDTILGEYEKTVTDTGTSSESLQQGYDLLLSDAVYSNDNVSTSVDIGISDTSSSSDSLSRSRVVGARVGVSLYSKARVVISLRGG